MTVNLNDILSECGLSRLTDEDKKDLATHLYESLELRVGMALAPMLSDEQLEEFEEHTKAKDDEGAAALLRRAVPNYERVIQDQVAQLKEELVARRQEILDAVGLGEEADVPAPSTPARRLRRGSSSG